MAQKLPRNLRGENWKSKLVHVEYKDNLVGNRYEFVSDLDALLKFDQGHYSVTGSSPLKSKIIKVTAFILDLTYSKWNSIKEAENLLKHHVIEIQNASGDLFTLEKGPDCILIQSCRVNQDETPVIRLQRDGQPRETIRTLQEIKADHCPKVL